MSFRHFQQAGYTYRHPDTHKVLGVSDLHINDPFTLFHNRRAHGFFQLLKWVNEVVFDGDTFTAGLVDPQMDFGGTDPWVTAKNKKYALKNRYHPQRFLENDILKPHRHLSAVTYIPANHDGQSASDANEYTDMLHRVSRNYGNFLCQDIYQKNNLMMFHGHLHFEYVHHNEEGDFFYKVYPNGINARAGDTINVPAYNDCNRRMAEAICETDIVKDFIHSRRQAMRRTHAAVASSDTLDLYVDFGNRHRRLNETVHVDGANIHVADLGCTVKHKASNYKIYHFLHDEIVGVETVDLKRVSEEVEKYPVRRETRRRIVKREKVA